MTISTTGRFNGTPPKNLIVDLELLDSQGKLPSEIAHKAISLTGIEPDSCNDEEYSSDLAFLEEEVSKLLA